MLPVIGPAGPAAVGLDVAAGAGDVGVRGMTGLIAALNNKVSGYMYL